MSSVYFFQIAPDGPIKIGTTAGNPYNRLCVLQTGCPYPIKMIGSLPGTAQNEQSLHRQFRAHRMNGEWFSPAVAPFVEQILRAGYEWPPIEPSVAPENEVHRAFVVSIEAFLISANISATAFGKRAVRDPNFVGDLRSGRMPNLGLVHRVNNFMSAAAFPKESAQ